MSISMKSYQLGVSLVELMVTLTVVVILLSIAMPSFTNIRDEKRLRAAAEAVYAYLQFARSESIKQDRNLIVRVKPGDGSSSLSWCLGISNSADCDCDSPGNCLFGPAGSQEEKTLKSNLFPDISIFSNKANIAFDSRRGTNLNAGTITLTGVNSASIDLIHSRRGRIRMCSDTIRGYPSCS